VRHENETGGKFRLLFTCDCVYADVRDDVEQVPFGKRSECPGAVEPWKSSGAWFTYAVDTANEPLFSRRNRMSEEEYYAYEATVAEYARAVESGVDPDEAASIALGSVATPRA
jgi:hypothetical protein